jgi:outer membrane protein OmpA-like peptidoglycan-associated protein
MTFRGISLVIALPLAAACAHSTKNATADAAPHAAPSAVEAVPAVASAPAGRACSTDDQCSASELCVSQRCVAITPGLAECRATAHFDFDRSDVRQADQPGLQRAARCLAALPGEKAQVEGNCDERGTEQYNIALGFRRAHSVAKYLQDLGVPAKGVSEVSYGKERLLCTDSSESCHATNRRAEVAAQAATADSGGGSPAP